MPSELVVLGATVFSAGVIVLLFYRIGIAVGVERGLLQKSQIVSTVAAGGSSRVGPERCMFCEFVNSQMRNQELDATDERMLLLHLAKVHGLQR